MRLMSIIPKSENPNQPNGNRRTPEHPGLIEAKKVLIKLLGQKGFNQGKIWKNTCKQDCIVKTTPFIILFEIYT